jgi:hypothetical protein
MHRVSAHGAVLAATRREPTAPPELALAVSRFPVIPTAHQLISISGLVCTDAGLNGNAIVSEYGYANFGAQYGGLRTSWDLSHVGLAVNLPTQLSSSDGQTVTCTSSGCAANQAYNSPTDYAADRNSPLGQTYTHTFCP